MALLFALSPKSPQKTCVLNSIMYDLCSCVHIAQEMFFTSLGGSPMNAFKFGLAFEALEAREVPAAYPFPSVNIAIVAPIPGAPNGGAISVSAIGAGGATDVQDFGFGDLFVSVTPRGPAIEVLTSRMNGEPVIAYE